MYLKWKKCEFFRKNKGLRPPVRYLCRELRGPETRYSATERERLALAWIVITLSPYLLAKLSDSYYKFLREKIDQGETIPFQVEPESGALTRSCYDYNYVVIPESLRARLLNMSHHVKIAGHVGRRKNVQVPS